MIAQHNSESNEHYTPADIVERARYLMGGIYTDPASCWEANQAIGAIRYFTKDQDGLRHWDKWRGNVFLNPPGGLLRHRNEQWEPVPKNENGHYLGPGKSSMEIWWNHLALNYADGRIDQAFFVAFNLEILRTSQSMTPVHKFYRCYPRERMRFGGMKQPTHANLLVWLPPKRKDWNVGFSPGIQDSFLKSFKNMFEEIGFCEGPANS